VFGNSCQESFLSTQPKPKTPKTKTEDLKNTPWYQSGLRSELSLELLVHQSTGSFLVHKNASKSKTYILSLRVPNGDAKVEHYLIQHSQKGYRIKGSSKSFATVTSLVTHHSVMPENLPVTLSLPRPQNIPSKCKNEDDYDNFSTLEDLRTIFTDLEL
jgi:tensin